MGLDDDFDDEYNGAPALIWLLCRLMPFSAAGYCRQLKAECRESEREADALRTEIESLSVDIK